MNTPMQFPTQPRFSLPIAALIFCLASLNSPGQSTVSTPTEGALRAAMAGGGRVTFACDGTISLSATITNALNTTLDAAGHQIIISGAHAVSPFYIRTNTTLSLLNLTVADGFGTNGGAIYNDGGALNATNVVFAGNLAQSTPPDTAVAAGGAVFAPYGQVTVHTCRFLDNSAFAGPQGTPGLFTSGTEARGGALYNGGALGVISCTFSNNSATGGNGAYWAGSIGGPAPPAGSGGPARGGAVFNTGSMRVERTLFAGNTAAAGAAGNGASGVNDNPWQSCPGQAGGQGGSGYGGAVANQGQAALINCTFAGNTGIGTSGGNGGDASHFWFNYVYYELEGGRGGNAGDACGALWCGNGMSVSVTNCTFGFNDARQGNAGTGGNGSPHGLAGNSGFAGGGLMTGPTSLGTGSLLNCLLATNLPGNSSGVLIDLGHNLSSDASCAFTNATSRNLLNPLVGPLSNNGGPNYTIPLLLGSPAVDAGDTAAAPTTDQRGFARPVNLRVDIGAYELGLLAPRIVAPPVDQTAALGTTARFTVEALAFPSPIFRWFFNVTNRLSGATNSTLDLPNVQLAQAGSYSVLVSNIAGSLTSAPVRLTVVQLRPTILSPPVSQNVELYSNATFSVTTDGSLPQFFQWFFNDTNKLAAGTNPVLQLLSARFSDSGAYKVVVTNAFGAVTSPPATLTVYSVPAGIAVNPGNRAAIVGSDVDLVVQARGSAPLSYQWFFNGTTPLPGGTDAVLHLSGVQVGDSGSYSVRVTNAFGMAVSVPAIVAITPAGTQAIVNMQDADLRSALANGGRIVFAVDGTITLTSPLPAIQGQVMLDGSGHQVTISGSNAFPIFNVPAGAVLGLANVTLRDARSSWGAALLVNGSANATNCLFLRNAALGRPNGGAVWSVGSFIASGCTFAENSVSGGNGVSGHSNYPNSPTGPEPGSAASGGAVASSGDLLLDRSLFVSNSVTGGTGGVGAPGNYYAGPNCYATSGGMGGAAFGGALAVSAGSASIVNSTFAENTATGGRGGEGGSMSGPAPYVSFGPSGGSGGEAVGAIYYSGGIVTVRNCTIGFNSSIGGSGGPGGSSNIPGAGGHGGDACGGLAGNVNLVNTLVVSNLTTGGSGGYGSVGYTRIDWHWGYAPAGAAFGNLRGPLSDLGHNLSCDISSGLTNVTSLSGMEARVGRLSFNGGLTLTIPLLPLSPAIDAADNAYAPATDQRGVPRVGPAADIGAYEYGFPGYLQASLAIAGLVNLTGKGTANATFVLESSTNLGNWLPVSTNTLDNTGTVLIQQNVGASSQRYYRLRFAN